MIVVCISFLILMIGCEDQSTSVIQKTSTSTTEVIVETELSIAFNESNTRTYENMTWITVRETFIDTLVRAETVMKIVHQFEINNPDLEIISWQVEAAGNNVNYVNGIWLRHKSR